MKQAIIIPTHKSFNHWYINCVNTIKTKYPLIMVINTDENNQFELAAIHKAISMEIDEFVVLQDTIEIKDNDLFKILFEDYKGKSVFLNPMGQMFLNKYLLSEIKQIKLPIVTDKMSAINAETNIHREYITKFKPHILFPKLVDNPKREEKLGRTNMIIENEYLKKYKGCWNPNMVK